MITTALSWCAVVGLLGLGTLSLPFPAFMSRAYGVPADEPVALLYVQATGARDLVMGLVLAWALATGQTAAAGAVMLSLALLAAIDLTLASRRGAPWPARAFHGGGGVVLAVLGVWGLRG